MTTPFDPQPTLAGDLLVVRPLRADDWDGMFAAASDPLIWEQHPSPDRYTESAFREYFDGGLARGMAFSFVDRATGSIIGSSRYYEPDPDRSEVEIGWTFLARPCWGGAYNREAKALMLEHAFRWFDTVIFWVAENNQRSRHAMLKIGGVLRDGIVSREISGHKPYVVFEIRRNDWQARQQENGRPQ